MKRCGAEPLDVPQAIGELAAELAVSLTTLWRLVEPVTDWTTRSAVLGPADEWAIAVDGLLGSTGILSVISDAFDETERGERRVV